MEDSSKGTVKVAIKLANGVEVVVISLHRLA
jgi:hypothetical protein